MSLERDTKNYYSIIQGVISILADVQNLVVLHKHMLLTKADQTGCHVQKCFLGYRSAGFVPYLEQLDAGGCNIAQIHISRHLSRIILRLKSGNMGAHQFDKDLLANRVILGAH